MTSKHAIKFICVQTYLSEQEATLAQSELQLEGIQAVLESSSAATTFSAGAATGGVRLMVDKTELTEAQAILQKFEAPTNANPWYCEKCQETIEPSFECCWSCGGERSEVEGQTPGAEDNGANSTGSAFGPQARDQAAHQIAEDVAADLSARAWRSAIIGLLTLPVLLHAYSLTLVFQAMFHPAPWTKQQMTRLIGALVIDIFAILGSAILLRSFWQMYLIY
ncbi:MAG: hypothetical protein U0930_03130 [Pirellulales bacterium]